MADEIGGYFARLRLIVDQEDFNTGVRSLAMMEYEIKQTSDKTATAKNNWKEFVTGIAASVYILKTAASALKDMYNAFVQLNAQTLKVDFQAASMGMSPRDLQSVFNAGAILGVSQGAMSGSVGQLSDKLGMITKGEMDPKQATYMGGFLGLDFSKEKDKNPVVVLGDIIQAGLNTARGLNKKDPEYQSKLDSVASIIGSLTGDAGRTLYEGLMSDPAHKLGLYNWSDLSKQGSLLNFQTNSGMKGAGGFSIADNELKTAWDSIMHELAGAMGDKLTPVIMELVNFLINHKADIEGVITTIANVFGAFVKLGEYIGKLFHFDSKVTNKINAEADVSEVMMDNGWISPNLSKMSEKDKRRFYIDEMTMGDFNPLNASMELASVPGWSSLFTQLQNKYNPNNPYYGLLGISKGGTGADSNPLDSSYHWGSPKVTVQLENKGPAVDWTKVNVTAFVENGLTKEVQAK